MARRDYGFSAFPTQHWVQTHRCRVSGYDGDGAGALCGIKEVGGTTIAQKLDQPGKPDMLRAQ